MVKVRTITSWVFIFLLFVLIPPEGVSYVFNGINDLLKSITILTMCIFLFLSFIKKRFPTFVTILLIAFNMWLILVTALFKNDALSTAVLSGMRVMSLCLIFDYYRNDMQIIFDACTKYYFIVISINFLTVLFTYPNGIYNRLDGTAEYFLGYRNAFILFFLPALFFALLEFYRKRKTIKLVLLFSMCIIPTLIENSSTTSLSLIVALFIFLVINLKSKLVHKKSNIRGTLIYMIFGIYLFFNVALISLNLIAQSDMAAYFIENVLGRSTTFTGRTNIWMTAMAMIARNPFYGYGVGNNVSYGGTIWYGHNLIIEVMLEGGVVAISIFAILIILLLKRTQMSKYAFHYNSMLIVLPALYVFFLTEASTLQHFVPIYILGCNMDNYIKCSKIDDMYRRQI